MTSPPRRSYKHMDVADLEKCLQQATDAGARIKVRLVCRTMRCDDWLA